MKLDVTLQSLRYLAQFDSASGAVCYRLYDKVNDCEILRTPESEEALAQNPFLYGNPILFPPNRIRGGSFAFDGRQYRFPINEPDTGCYRNCCGCESLVDRVRCKTRPVFCSNAKNKLQFVECFAEKHELTFDGIQNKMKVSKKILSFSGGHL